MSHDVFISYSSKDKAIADAVCAKLEDEKIRCWIAPRDVPPGANFAGSIVDAIDNCKIFVLIWSANTNASEHILNELNQAFDDGTPVIPFRVENVEPSKALKYYIGRTHWLDAMTPPLEKHIITLAETILTNLGRQAEIKPKIPVVKEKEVREEKKKEKDIKPVSKTSAKSRAWWPYLVGLFGVALVVGLALTIFKQPVQPTSNITLQTLTSFPSSKTQIQPTNNLVSTEASTSPPTQGAATPRPTEAPIQSTASIVGYQTKDLGTPYYQTTFTNVSFGEDWPVRDSKGQKLVHGEDDKYQLQVQAPSNMGVALYRDGKKVFANSIIEVEAEFLPGTKNGGFGIICRASYPQSHGYSLVGYVASFKQSGRITINMTHSGKDDLFTMDGPILEPGISYRLRFDCIGQKLTVYENGVKIGEAQDNAYYVGSIGLIVEGSGGPSQADLVSVDFDNFKLWLP